MEWEAIVVVICIVGWFPVGATIAIVHGIRSRRVTNLKGKMVELTK